MTAIVLRSVEIRIRIDAVRSRATAAAAIVLSSELLDPEARSRRPVARYAFDANASDANDCRFARAVRVQAQEQRRRRQRQNPKRDAAPSDMPDQTPGRFRNANLAENLAGVKAVVSRSTKKSSALDRSLAVRANRNHLGFERDDRRRPIAGRIGVRDAAADRSFVSHLHVANV